jgi:hypothetical protein
MRGGSVVMGGCVKGVKLASSLINVSELGDVAYMSAPVLCGEHLSELTSSAPIHSQTLE